MLHLNSTIASIAPSATLGMAARAKQLAAGGRKVLSFAAGEPDFDTPTHIKMAAIRALELGETKYAPGDGLPALRQAIAEKLLKENQLPYKPEQIVVSNGAKHSIFNVCMALCNPGDEVIIPAPYWLSYPEMVRIAGAVPVFVAGQEEKGFRITADDLEAKITARTRAVIINSPCNPSGIVYSRAELHALAETALKHDLLIVSDEIYEKIIYDGMEHVSVGSLSRQIFEHTVTVNGYAKAYSMPGWRLGYMAGPVELAKAVSALQSHSTSGAVTFAQYGAIEAHRESQECVARMAEAFAERRAFLHQRLTSIRGITCVKPMGAFYMLPNVGSFGLKPQDFAEKLLNAEAVAVVPGEPFGAFEHIRISYACSLASLREGMDRLEHFTAALG